MSSTSVSHKTYVHYETSVQLRVVPPPCPIRTAPVDFSHAAELIDRAAQTTREWLDATLLTDTGQAKLLTPHEH